MKLAGDANRLKEMQVTGTDDNKQFSEFCFSVLKLNEKDAQMRAATYIRSHPQSLTSVALFYHYFDRVAQRNEQPTLELLNLLRKQQPTNQQLTAIDARLRPQLHTAIGAKLPHFTASTLNKQVINSADFKGKPTLLTFSANWDSNNYYLRQQLRKLKAARGERLRIINFSLDESLEKAQERFPPICGLSQAYALQPSCPNFGSALSFGQHSHQCRWPHHWSRFPHRRTRQQSQRCLALIELQSVITSLLSPNGVVLTSKR